MWGSLAILVGGDWVDARTGDFDGNGFSDIALRNSSNERVWFLLSDGSTFDKETWGKFGSGEWDNVQTGDFNCDLFTDLVARDATGRWWVFHSDPASRELVGEKRNRWALDAMKPWESVLVVDFDGDGITDVAARKENTPVMMGNPVWNWWVLTSSTP